MATIYTLIRTLESNVKRVEEFFQESSNSAVREAFVTVAHQGWYLGPGMLPREVMRAARAIDDGNVGALDESFTRYYEEQSASLLEQLSVWHPRRIGIIRKAVEAHRRGDYELSVPVFLAQSDGVSQELTKFKLFGKRTLEDGSREPETAAFVRKSKAGPFRRALIEPFQHLLPVTASEAKRRKMPDLLNRHAVLHGTSLDYGTRVNSAKAFALLYYVAWVFRPHKEKTKANPQDRPNRSAVEK